MVQGMRLSSNHVMYFMLIKICILLRLKLSMLSEVIYIFITGISKVLETKGTLYTNMNSNVPGSFISPN